jgi:hypothetical protein
MRASGPRVISVLAPPALLAAATLAIAVVLILTPLHTGAQSGRYLEFSGPSSGWLEVPDDGGLNPGSAITVEAWIYLESYAGFGGGQTDCPIIAGKNWSQSYALSLACGGNVMDSFINGEEQYSEAHPIPLRTWTHLAMTYDGAARRHYVNGELDLDIPNALGPIGDTTDRLRIGNDVAWDFSPNGRIDDVRIWNVARSQGEIASTMNGVPANSPGLAANWTFIEGSLTDIVGGRAGTLSGNVQVAGPTPVPTQVPGIPVEPGTPGDYDCDQMLWMPDALGLLSELAVTPPSPPPCASPTFPEPPDVRDADCDGEFTVRDPLAVLRVVARVDTRADCPTPTPSPG